MKFGLIGLPNSGKTTLFNVLTKNSALVQAYPFSTIEPNSGFLKVKDQRLSKIQEITKSKVIENAHLEVIDVAGLVKGANEGVGLGNKFLSFIRVTDLIVFVIRCFLDDEISHFYNNVDPCRDFEILKMELILADLEIVERKKNSFKGKRGEEIIWLEKAVSELKGGRTLGDFYNNCFEKGKKFFNCLNLITIKPAICALNLGDFNVSNIENIESLCKNEKIESFRFYGKYEEELAKLEEDEQRQFREELNIKEDSLDNLIKAIIKRLNLITFFTFNEKEVKAWFIEGGKSVKECAGKIHTDLMKGFIKAEVINYRDFITFESWNDAKEKGFIRIEGEDYKVEEGDIILIKFR